MTTPANKLTKAAVAVVVALAIAGLGFRAYQEAEQEKARASFCEGVERLLVKAGTLLSVDADAALAEAQEALGRLNAPTSNLACDAGLAAKASDMASKARVQPFCVSAHQSLSLVTGDLDTPDFGQILQRLDEFDAGHAHLVEHKAHCLDRVNDELRDAKGRLRMSLQKFLDDADLQEKAIDFSSVDETIVALGDESLLRRWESWRRLLDSGQALPVVVTYSDWAGTQGPLIQAPKEAKLRSADKKRIAGQVRRILKVPFVLYGARAEESIRENVEPLVLEVNAKWKSYQGQGPWPTSVATEIRMIARYGGGRLGTATVKDDVPASFEIKTRYGVPPQAMIRDSEAVFRGLLEDLDRQGALDRFKDKES